MGFSPGTSEGADIENDVSIFDAFGRQRTSEPYALFDYSFRFDKQPLLFDESTATGGTSTHSTNQASVQMAVTSSSGSSVIRQSKMYIPYQPGKSHQVVLSGNMGTVQANCRKRIGLFDANDGVFFEQNGTTLNVVVRSSVSGSIVDTAVAQSDWNIDKLDGTGSSTVTIDTSKQNLFFIDFQWLGSGRIRFGFVINGKIIYCHEVLNSNTLTTPYSRSGSLPVRYEITNTGATAGAVTMLMTCGSVVSEGGFGPAGIIRAVSNEVTTKTISTTVPTPIISLRLGSSFIRSSIQILDIQVFCSSVDDVQYYIYFNSSLTGASFAAAASGSTAEFSTAETAMTGGILLHTGYIRGAGSAPSIANLSQLLEKSENSLLGSNLSGTADIVTVAARSFGTTANMVAAITFRELT